MPAYTISVFGDDDVTVAELPAVAPNQEAAMEAARPWVDWIATQTSIKPLWYKATWRPGRADKPVAALA